MFQSMALESSDNKPQLTNSVSLRWREDGVVVFYMGKGEPRMGVRSGPKTEALRDALESAYIDAVSLEVSI